MTKTRLDVPPIVRTCWKPSDALRKIPRLPEGPRDQFGIKPGANLPSPRLRRNEPFPFEALALAPASAVRNGASLTVVERLKSIVAVRLDEPPHLFNGLPGFRRFRPAALAYPLFERPGRRRRRLALAPRRHAQQRSPTRPPSRSSPAVAPPDQPGHRRLPAGESETNSPTMAANVFARHLSIDQPLHEFRPGHAIGRQRRLLERLGQFASVAVRPGMIENAKAAIGRNIQHAHQLAGARLAPPIFRQFRRRRLFRPSIAP